MNLIEYDNDSLVEFYIKNGLEFDDVRKYFGKDVKSFALVSDDKVIGAVSISKYKDKNFIEAIAVDESYRRKGYGKLLLDKSIHEMKPPVYTISKEHKFYLDYGFIFDDTDLISDVCKTCSEYNVTCFPKVVVYNKFELKKIDNDNLELACQIQNEIFPEEDARENFLEAIRKDPYRKELDYQIVYINDEPVGVTGIYSYHEYPSDAWLGWFGILSKYRRNGYGELTLKKTIELAKEKGYKTIRLYTDEYAKEAHKLYEKLGFIKEDYNREDDRDEYFTADVYIYSKSLNNEKVELWNNKLLGLKEQGVKENLYK